MKQTKHSLEIALLSINQYFNKQLYSIEIEEDLANLLDMTVEEIKNHLFHFDNMGYIIYPYCIHGAVLQHIQNDLNKFIQYYVISNLKREVIPNYVIKTTAKKCYMIISKYREINPDLFDILIQYMNNKVENLIETLISPEFEDYEACSNLKSVCEELESIIKNPT